MKRKYAVALLTILAASAALPHVTRGEDEGLPDLDAAVELKVAARDEGDMERVVALCKSALEKGLSEDDRAFATLLLTSTLYEHASVYASQIFDRDPPSPEWAELRRRALPKLQMALQHDDKLPYIHYLIARLESLPDGNREKALEAVSAAIRHAGDDKGQLSDALLLRGNLAEDEQSRLADYNQSIVINPANDEALRMRGTYFLAKEDYEKAIADFGALLELDPTDLLAHNALAEAFTFQEKYDDALKHIERAIEQNPNSAAGYTLRARIYALKEDLKSAAADLDKALSLEPRNVPALLMRARLHVTNEDLKSAKLDIERALVIRPDLVEAIFMLSVIAAAEGDYETAALNMRRLLRADPENVAWQLQLARYYNAGQRPRRAIELYTLILEDDPQNADALHGRGDALLSIGKHAEAISDYEEALKADPEDDGVLNNLAWVLATSPDDKVRNGKRSIELGKKACEVTEYKAAHILSTLAAGYAETGDFETAIKWSSKAVELGKDDEEMLKQLKEELENYQQKKPWRELQETEEKDEPNRGGGDFEL